jgi:hypothetical protein
MTAEFKLRPCPFCGGAVEVERCADTFERQHGQRQWWGVVCRTSRNRGGACAVEIRPSTSVEVAAERWNLRVPEDTLRAALRGLLASLDNGSARPAPGTLERARKALK